MSWTRYAVEALRRGEAARIRPHGRSMRGRIEDGDTVLLLPCCQAQLRVGDAVLVRVRGSVLLHLVHALQGERLLIGNNRGGINGWVGKAAVYGVAVEVAGKTTAAAHRVGLGRDSCHARRRRSDP